MQKLLDNPVTPIKPANIAWCLAHYKFRCAKGQLYEAISRFHYLHVRMLPRCAYGLLMHINGEIRIYFGVKITN